ncbi:MAG: TolC family protein [Neisseriales bacterium]|nr:MAG: TolC family protein [Neisseriales bacterium]
MKKISHLSYLYLTTFLGGCAIFHGQNQPPKIDYPTTTSSGVQFESAESDFSQLQWWRKFNDPVLDNLIQEVLANNNEIQISVGQIMEAQAKLKAAQYAWIPTLNASATGFAGNSWATNLTPQGSLAANNTFPSGAVANSDFSGFMGGFMPSYSFNVFQNISQSKLAQASVDVQKANYNNMKLSIIGQTAGSYFMLLGQNKQLSLQKEMVKDLEDLKQAMLIKYQNGGIDYSEIALVDQQIDSYQSKIPLIENSIIQTNNALAVLLNKNPGTMVKNIIDIDRLPTEKIIPVNLPSAVLRNRPDMIIAENNLKMADANIDLAYSVFFPTISLTGNIGGASMALTNLFSMGTGFWTAMAAANMPILNASSFEQIKAAKGGYYVSYYNYMQTVKSAFANVDNTLSNNQKQNQSYTKMLSSLKNAQTFYNLTLVQYNYGSQDYQNLLGAKVNADLSKLNINQSKMQQLDSIVQVYQAVAGGYGSESSIRVKGGIIIN